MSGGVVSRGCDQLTQDVVTVGLGGVCCPVSCLAYWLASCQLLSYCLIIFGERLRKGNFIAGQLACATLSSFHFVLRGSLGQTTARWRQQNDSYFCTFF